MLRTIIVLIFAISLCGQNALAQSPLEAFVEAAKSLLNNLQNKNSMKDDAYKYANSDEFDPRESCAIYKPNRAEKFIPPACGLRVAPCYARAPYRNLDGSCNNLNFPLWGVPNNTYFRLMPSKYGDNYRSPRRANDGGPLPNTRVIRTALFPQGNRASPLFNLNTMLWGQFVAHDMSLIKEPEFSVPCCSNDSKYVPNRGRFCYPVKIPPSDRTMGRGGIGCLNFTRTVTDKDMGCVTGNIPAQQINAVTSFLDLSNVYGLSQDMANGLRSFQRGRLRTETRNNHIFPPTDSNVTATCFCTRPGENVCYQTGDSRSNQNPQLAILQTLFVREHNRIATRLSEINWHWGDQRLFQEARKILIAMYQRISYYEWLPLLLGRDNLLQQSIIYNQRGFVNDYDVDMNPSVTQEHAHAAYRFFHTHIVGRTSFMNPARSTTNSFQLFDWYHRPAILEQGDNIEQLTVGMVTQNMEESDNIHVEDITDKMFACGRPFGLDLRAFDFQRDRDHGLSYYNDYRMFCGLGRATSFDGFKDVIPAEYIGVLRTLYKSHEDVDLSVGGSLETLVPGAQCGPTFLCIMNDQFTRTRKGDRYWFENESSGFTPDQLAEIRKASVSRIFCDNGDGIRQMQPDGFSLISGFNSLQTCASLPRIDLTKWQEVYF